MHSVLLLGGGKVGRMIARFLGTAPEYRLIVADNDEPALERLQARFSVETRHLDAARREDLEAAMQGVDSVLSALSFSFNPLVAEVACDLGVSYFDLTEDVATTRAVKQVASRARPGQVFMPQCGLAPGFVSVAAHELTQGFDRLDKVFMRVGALPQFPSNALKYNLTWSTDGLINEYLNPCESIHQGARRDVLPLEGLEHFSIDGVRYEAFNTSGGLGTLCETLDGKVHELNYKTIRYQGHRDLMAFLIAGLKLGDRRDLLKEILENAVPVTYQDVVVVFCTVSGLRRGKLEQVTDARKIYSAEVDGEVWSAIQITTAAGICAMLDLHREGRLRNSGFLRQEEVSLPTFLQNRFGAYYQPRSNTAFSITAEGEQG
jgi:saccharopine dehydrogenase-like NADP-dependent oxidoreductase